MEILLHEDLHELDSIHRCIPSVEDRIILQLDPPFCPFGLQLLPIPGARLLKRQISCFDSVSGLRDFPVFALEISPHEPAGTKRPNCQFQQGCVGHRLLKQADTLQATDVSFNSNLALPSSIVVHTHSHSSHCSQTESTARSCG